MRAILELPNFECLVMELKHQGLTECRLTGIAKDELTQDKPKMEYRSFYLIFTALAKDANIIRYRIKIGQCFIFEEEQMQKLKELTVQNKQLLTARLEGEGIKVFEGEWLVGDYH